MARARIGIMALQGAFLEHAQVFQRLGNETVEVRLPEDLKRINGLVIPGGESTTMSLLVDTFRLREPIAEMARAGLPIWGTCAGIIMLAKWVIDPLVRSLELIDLRVQRNAFGRQVDSFEAELPVPVLGDRPFHAVFIRAPVVEVAAAEVELLARLPDGRIVAARQGNWLATAFHPELTDDPRFHKLFLSMIPQA